MVRWSGVNPTAQKPSAAALAQMFEPIRDDLREVEREFVRPEFVALGTKLACAEMIRSGTTCFADMYYFEDAVAQAAADAGVRAFCGQTVLKFPAPDAPSFEDSLALARDIFAKQMAQGKVPPQAAQAPASVNA